MRLYAEQDDLNIRFAQVGVDWPGGWHWQPWDFCGFQPNDQDQGREAVDMVVEELRRATGVQPILLMIMDPARCYDLTRIGATERGGEKKKIDAKFWGYYPLDAYNRLQAIGGPAARAVLDTDRLLGYGRWGAQVLKKTLEIHQPKFRKIKAPAIPPMSYLPHGIDTRIFHPGVPMEEADDSFRAWTRRVPKTAVRIGCVATNQARKDLGLLFSTMAEIKALGNPVAIWLHTDKLTHIWDVGELVTTCGLDVREVAVSTQELSDRQMAARYGWSDLTIAPGLGEGFGYPIVESLACGTPVVHGDYAGGVELIPNTEWLVEARAWRLESVYALLRPVFHPKDVAETVRRVIDQKAANPDLVQAYCAGAVAHLDWEFLWPRWRAWIKAGLDG